MAGGEAADRSPRYPPDFKTAAIRDIDLGGVAVRLRAPASPDRLLASIDAATFSPDEKMPYWAEIWPGGVSFARYLFQRPPAVDLAGKDVLELGSGLGLLGITALLVGAGQVTFSDWFHEALDFCRQNAIANGQSRFETLHVDWRKPKLPRRYEVVIGSDILYELRNLEHVLDAIQVALVPGGTAYVADPDRITASDFVLKSELRGFQVDRRPIATGQTLYTLKRPPAARDTPRPTPRPLPS
jgi:predicted nicotinamide N-methyase